MYCKALILLDLEKAGHRNQSSSELAIMWLQDKIAGGSGEIHNEIHQFGMKVKYQYLSDISKN